MNTKTNLKRQVASRIIVDVEFESAKRKVATQLMALQSTSTDTGQQKEFCIALRDAKLIFLRMLDMLGISFVTSGKALLQIGEKGLTLLTDLPDVDQNVIDGVTRHNLEIREALEKMSAEVEAVA